jgi:DNA helicase HerA-like ATPase
VDLSEVPSEVLNVAISVLCRLTFDFAIWSERAVPILLVCEEAHRYCSQRDGSAARPAHILERIAKEGRKYGISLCLVSQRPSEITPAVLSQCNTIFALRMSNGDDQTLVRGGLREATAGLIEFLPALRNGEAIAIGEGVSVPVRLCFDQLSENCRPRSSTAIFSEAWKKDIQDAGFMAEVVERWRSQRR